MATTQRDVCFTPNSGHSLVRSMSANDVHGPSEVIDRAYDWQCRGWRGRPGMMVFSEAHVGTFTRQATFRAVIGKLDHLAATGITAIELMPLSDRQRSALRAGFKLWPLEVPPLTPEQPPARCVLYPRRHCSSPGESAMLHDLEHNRRRVCGNCVGLGTFDNRQNTN